MKKQIKLVANNKKAYHDYFVDETYEAGIVLTGTEIKSVRQGKVSIKEAYVRIRNGEAIVQGMNISPYEQGNRFNVDPLRYINEDGRAKIELGLCRGKKNYDKREAIAKKDAQRSMERSMRNH